jgi:hypothetical protein
MRRWEAVVLLAVMCAACDGSRGAVELAASACDHVPEVDEGEVSIAPLDETGNLPCGTGAAAAVRFVAPRSGRWTVRAGPGAHTLSARSACDAPPDRCALAREDRAPELELDLEAAEAVILVVGTDGPTSLHIEGPPPPGRCVPACADGSACEEGVCVAEARPAIAEAHGTWSPATRALGLVVAGNSPAAVRWVRARITGTGDALDLRLAQVHDQDVDVTLDEGAGTFRFEAALRLRDLVPSGVTLQAIDVDGRVSDPVTLDAFEAPAVQPPGGACDRLGAHAVCGEGATCDDGRCAACPVCGTRREAIVAATDEQHWRFTGTPSGPPESCGGRPLPDTTLTFRAPAARTYRFEGAGTGPLVLRDGCDADAPAIGVADGAAVVAHLDAGETVAIPVYADPASPDGFRVDISPALPPVVERAHLTYVPAGNSVLRVSGHGELPVRSASLRLSRDGAGSSFLALRPTQIEDDAGTWRLECVFTGGGPATSAAVALVDASGVIGPYFDVSVDPPVELADGAACDPDDLEATCAADSLCVAHGDGRVCMARALPVVDAGSAHLNAAGTVLGLEIRGRSPLGPIRGVGLDLLDAQGQRLGAFSTTLYDADLAPDGALTLRLRHVFDRLAVVRVVPADIATVRVTLGDTAGQEGPPTDVPVTPAPRAGRGEACDTLGALSACDEGDVCVPGDGGYDGSCGAATVPAIDAAVAYLDFPRTLGVRVRSADEPAGFTLDLFDRRGQPLRAAGDVLAFDDVRVDAGFHEGVRTFADLDPNVLVDAYAVRLRLIGADGAAGPAFDVAIQDRPVLHAGDPCPTAAALGVCSDGNACVATDDPAVHVCGPNCAAGTAYVALDESPDPAGWAVDGDNARAPNRPGGTCGGAGPADLYTFSAPETGTYVFATGQSGPALDTVLYVRASCLAGAELACNDDTGGGDYSRVTLRLVAGQTVYVFVAGARGAIGPYRLLAGRL